MKINLKNTINGLMLCADEDYEKKCKLKLDTVYTFECQEFRNYLFHKKFFKLIDLSWEYVRGDIQESLFQNSKNVFRQTLIISAGYCDRVYSLTKKEFQDVPKSIAFDKMNESEFSELYKSVKDVLFATFLKNITEEEFSRELINF